MPPAIIAAISLITWFALALACSRHGILAQFHSATLLAWGLAVPSALFSAIYTGSRPCRNWILALPLRALTLGEVPRILGGSFLLWKYSQGVLPAAFSLPTGISDIAAGATAIPAAWLLLSPSGQPKPGFLIWQLAGFTWLIISSASGIVTSPPALSLFPMNLVPVFFGPLMILFHLAALTITLRGRQILST